MRASIYPSPSFKKPTASHSGRTLGARAGAPLFTRLSFSLTFIEPGNRMSNIRYEMNPSLTNDELNPLYEVSWPAHTSFDFMPVLDHALAWVCAYDGPHLIGFVYVAWDGSQHAFLLEPTVHPGYRLQGIGTELVRRAAEAAREAGCEVLHVDYEARLAPFYEACGFRPTAAGLIWLRS